MDCLIFYAKLSLIIVSLIISYGYKNLTYLVAFLIFELYNKQKINQAFSSLKSLLPLRSFMSSRNYFSRGY